MRPALAVVLPLLLAAAVGAQALGGEFVYDDEDAIVLNSVVNGTAPALEAFERDFWGGRIEHGVRTYRPFSPLLMRGLYAMGGGTPTPFRLASLLLHVCAALALFFAARAAGLQPGRCAAATAIFAVHGLNAEATASLVSICDLASTALGFASIGLAFRASSFGRASLAAGVALVACLFKESAIVLAIAAALVLLLRDEHRVRALPLLVVIAGVTAVQLSLPRLPVMQSWDNSLSYAAVGGTRVALGLHNLARALAWCFVPLGLAPNHGFAAIDLSMDTLLYPALGGGLALALGLGLGVWALVRRNARAAVVIALLFGGPLICSGLFFPIMTDLPERLLYPATAAVALLSVTALHAYVNDTRLRVLALVLITLALALPGIELRFAWRTNASLWVYAADVEPRAVRNQWNDAHHLALAGRVEESAYHRMIALYVVNGYPDAVDWDRVEALTGRPFREAVIEGPGVLYEDPCPMVYALARHLTLATPRYRDEIFPDIAARYESCAPDASPQEPGPGAGVMPAPILPEAPRP